MEFVGNKKTACFCGTKNCSGLIGEKPKEEKRAQQPGNSKKKTKKRVLQPSVMKLSLQQPAKKRRRTLSFMKDPMEKMLEEMPEKNNNIEEKLEDQETEKEIDTETSQTPSE